MSEEKHMKSISLTLLPTESVSWVEIGEDAHEQRLDNFLFKKAKGVPKSHIYRLIRSGQIRINGRRAKAESKLQAGDLLRIAPIRIERKAEKRAAPIPAEALEILHEDRHLLVINKKAGIASHGGSGIDFGLIERLRATRPDEPMLELCHRLDKETSGAIIVAKTRKALVRMHDVMKEGGVEKHYYALMTGDYPNERQNVKLPLERYLLPSGERRVRVSKEGMSAHSIFTNLERFGSATLVDVELKTGRTHQIRVHSLGLGHPLVGDDKYGDFQLNRDVARGAWGAPFNRMFLHSRLLRFEHPVTREVIEVNAPLPRECEELLSALRKRTRG